MITKEESRIVTINRTIATVLILLCHYVGWFPRIAFTGQFFNVGVSVFFIISGYLYGQKKIGNVLTWLKRRYVTLSVPLYLYYVIGTVFLFVLGLLEPINGISIFKILLHLQGILGGGIGNLQTGHLWFVTFIFICYLITPGLQLLDLNLKQFVCTMIGVSVIEIFIMLTIGTYGYLSWTPGIFSYVIAYYIAGHWNKKISNKAIMLLTALMIASVGLRLGTKGFIDGTNLYNLVIVAYTHCIIAFWIFFFVFWFGQRSAILREKLYSICKFIDPYSYEIYIVHFCLIKGVLSLRNLTGNIAINTLAFLICTAGLSVGLKKTSEPIVSLFRRNK